MSAILERKLYLRVKINGTEVKINPGSVRITESLDNLCRVASLELAEQPESAPADGDPLTIDWVDGHADKYWALFAGALVAPTEVESGPWSYTLIATDQLQLLRRVHTGVDHDLTGLTDGQAWKAVADFCGVTYDDADIADAGYVLGALEAISWQVNVAGQQIIQELDDVFGMTTQTIGANRVIRFPVDWTPANGTGAYKTFTRGESFELQTDHRSRGTPDDIINAWTVKGVTHQLPNSCTAQPWSAASASNPQLGRRVRVTLQEFSSDFIQDEALAEAIVRRRMDMTNKIPDHLILTVEGDPNIHPGAKIGVVDPAYGIAADPRWCLVQQVDRNDYDMTLTVAAGPGGAEGTVTTGTDKICTSTHTGVSTPGDFTAPDASFPPLDDGFDLGGFDFPLGGFDLSGITLGGGLPFGTLPGLGGGPLHADMCTVEFYSDGVSIDGGFDWSIEGNVSLDDAASGLTIGVSANEGDYTLAVVGFASFLGGPSLVWQLTSPYGEKHAVGAAPVNEDITLKLGWIHSTNTLYSWVTGLGVAFYDDLVHAAAFASAVTTHTIIGSLGTNDFRIYHDCGSEGGGGGTVTTPVWHEIEGDTNLVSASEVHLTGGPSGVGGQSSAYSDGSPAPFDGSQRVRFNGTASYTTAPTSGVDNPITSIGLDNTSHDGGNFTGLQIEQDPAGAFPEAAHLYVYVDGAFISDTALTYGDAIVGFNWTIDFNFPANTITVTVLDADVTETLSHSTGLEPFIAYASGTAIEVDLTAMTVTVG